MTKVAFPNRWPGQQSILEQLERANLFLTSLDNRRQCYCYHHLFADSLRHRLHKERRAQGLAILNGRAADWDEHRGSIASAVRHALVGQDFGRGARLSGKIPSPFSGETKRSSG